MTGAAILFAILHTLLGILLVILLVLAAVLLLVLFVPVRYRFQGAVRDTEGSEPDLKRISEKSQVEGRISWLFRFLQAEIRWPETSGIQIRILGIPIALKKEKQEEPGDGVDSPEKKSKKKASPDWKALLSILKSPDTKQAIRVILEKTGSLLSRLLPKKWSLEGTVGMPDPQKTGLLMEAEGVVFPLVCGHIWVEPDFEQYGIDLNFFAEGGISLVRVVAAAVVLLCNKKVQLLIRKVRAVTGKSKESAGGKNQAEKTEAE